MKIGYTSGIPLIRNLSHLNYGILNRGYQLKTARGGSNPASTVQFSVFRGKPK